VTALRFSGGEKNEKNFFLISDTYKKSQDIVYFFIDNHNRLCNIAGLFVFL
jgi:hypothetical protein